MLAPQPPENKGTDRKRDEIVLENVCNFEQLSLWHLLANPFRNGGEAWRGILQPFLHGILFSVEIVRRAKRRLHRREVNPQRFAGTAVGRMRALVDSLGTYPLVHVA